MSAREEILGRIRTAVAGNGPGADPALPEVPRGYRSRPADPADVLVDRFVARVEDYRATVTRCTPEDVATTLATVLVEALPAGSAVVVPDGFPWPVLGAVDDAGLAAPDLDRIAAVVTTASVAVAETGTIVLTHGPGQGRRALSLVPDLHVCVVRADQVVPGVPEAVAALDPRRPQTWISGPSATSDIELSRVEGVHGPRTLHIVLVHA